MNLSLKVNNNNYYHLKKEYLDIAKGYDLESLSGIDDFLYSFSREDIMNSIKRSNIIADEHVFEVSELVITYFEKEKIRELSVHTLDDIDYITFDVIEFIIKNISKKNIINQINNYFVSKNYIPKSLIDFVNSLKSDGINTIINKYIILDYGCKRVLKDYIFNEILPKLDEKTLVRDNKTLKAEV